MHPRQDARPLAVRLLSSTLCAALALTAVGPHTAAHAAAVVKAVPVQAAGIGGLGASGASLSGASLNLSNTLTLSAPAQGAVLPQIPSALVSPSLSAAGSQSAAANAAASANPSAGNSPAAAASNRAAANPNGASGVAGSAVAAAQPGAPKQNGSASVQARGQEAQGREAQPTNFSALQTGAEKISKAAAPSARASALSALFTGEKNRRGLSDAVFAAADNLGQTEALGGLGTLSSADREAVAVDSKKPLAERLAAVKAVASDKDALVRISAANPEGAADDYEVHRAALKALAEGHNDVRSLRTITRAHADAILKKLEGDKPEMLISDYDDTLSKFNTPIEAETGAALEAAADAGVETVILTDRPDFKKRDKDVTIIDSLQPLTQSQKAKLTVVSSRGTRISFFDKKGEPVLVQEQEVSWSDKEKADVLAAAAVVKEKYGTGDFNGKTEDLSAYGYALFLPVGMPIATVREAARLFEAELKKSGTDIPVTAREAKNPQTDPPSLNITKIDKSIGVLPLRSNIRRIDQVRSLLKWVLPSRFAKRAWNLLSRLPARPVTPQKTLLLGDQFLDPHIADVGFVKGSPGSLAISVGGTADPRLENIFVWPVKGAAGSREVLNALGKVAPSDMNKKAVVGMFAQRTVSISAFILTSIAYPFVAVPAVGWAGYGALMAFGPLAAIATGPLNGIIVDRLSARNAMAINTIVRALLALVLPAMAAFGILNFWSLLIASVANGWLLSSIMTTEGAYVKRLAGEKNVTSVNNLLFVNYFMIQVVLALLIGAGSIVDTMGPMITFYISAAVHAAVVLPIIWFTMPNYSPAPKTLRAMEKSLAATRKAKESAAGEKLDALVKTELELQKSIAARRVELEKNLIGKNTATVEAKTKLIAELEAFEPENGAELREIRAQIRAFKSEIGVLNREIESAKEELANEPSSVSRTLGRLGAWFKRNWSQVGAMAAAAAAYVAIESLTGMRVTLPLIAALVYWIASLDMFKALWSGRGSEATPEQKALEAKLADNQKKLKAGEGDAAALKTENRGLKKSIGLWQTRLRNAMLFMALSALMLYPLQYVALPNIAEEVMGKAGKGLFLGNLLGALFFGNMIANAATARMGEVKLPLLGRIAGEKFVQLLVAGLAAAWIYTGLVPGSFLAVAGGVAAVYGIMALARRLTERGWLKLFGVGYAAVWLPYLAWIGAIPMGVGPAALIAAMIIGLFNGPAYVAIVSYFHKSAREGNMGKMVGVQGSFFNAAISTGYGSLALGVALMTPAFPGLLAVLGILYIVGGILMWKAPDMLPGMPKTVLHPKKK